MQKERREKRANRSRKEDPDDKHDKNDKFDKFDKHHTQVGGYNPSRCAHRFPPCYFVPSPALVLCRGLLCFLPAPRPNLSRRNRKIGACPMREENAVQLNASAIHGMLSLHLTVLGRSVQR